MIRLIVVLILFIIGCNSNRYTLNEFDRKIYNNPKIVNHQMLFPNMKNLGYDTNIVHNEKSIYENGLVQKSYQYYYDTDSVKFETVYNYNSDKLISYERVYPDGEKLIWNLKYDIKNRLISKEFHNGVEEYTYTANGKLLTVKRTNYYKNDKETSSIKTYENGKILKYSIRKNESDDLLSYAIYESNQQGLIVKKEKYSKDSILIAIVEYGNHDILGNASSVEKYKLVNGRIEEDGALFSSAIYDKHKNLLSDSTFNEKNELRIITRYEYQY